MGLVSSRDFDYGTTTIRSPLVGTTDGVADPGGLHTALGSGLGPKDGVDDIMESGTLTQFRQVIEDDGCPRQLLLSEYREYLLRILPKDED